MKIAVKGAQSQTCLRFAEREQFAGVSRKIAVKGAQISNLVEALPNMRILRVAKSTILISLIFTGACLFLLSAKAAAQENTLHDLKGVIRLQYQNPGTQADLGVGLWAWPLPLDFDQDGDMDLVVSSSGNYPYNGMYLFENTTGKPFPDFKAPVRIGDGLSKIHVSYVGKDARVLGQGVEYNNFRHKALTDATGLFPAVEIFQFAEKVRSSQWKYVDYENDGDLDLLVGIDDWSEYGWDDAFDKNGKWTRGPLHGYVVLIENNQGRYQLKGKLSAGGKPIDQFGMVSPNMYDFDGDGDLDLICGEFTDRLTWFENTGTREKPEFAGGRFLENDNGLITMDLQMIVPNAVDWDGDGDIDLIVGDEDGRVAWIENTGQTTNHMPLFNSPVYFRQQAADLKFGALVTPFSVDWDNDGDEDLICGNTAGYIGFIENLDGGNPPRWREPVLLEADGKPIRIQAGENGSIQGPCERKWGYTTLSVADWDGDGLQDIVINSIWGKIEWFRNTGTKTNPHLASRQPVKIDWDGKTPQKPAWNWWDPAPDELVTQWRTTPLMTDWDRDGMMDLVMLDHEGYLAFFRRFNKNGEFYVHPGERIFLDADNGQAPLRLNERAAGKSGRRKLCLTDWDGDGDLDLLADSQNAVWYENTGEENGKVLFKKKNDLMDIRLTGHTTSPTAVDWNRDGVPELLLGAEDGHFYYLPR
ncbi:MAG: VCBS repeat-containing protein [Mangrovibacterium sp.]|nr:VCBS repeat-containing protein [Mangrovibacterium sp.]